MSKQATPPTPEPEGTPKPAPGTAKRNPNLYREMSVPFPDVEAAQAAAHGFFDELYALRAKYKIPDIYAVLQFNFLHEGDEVNHIAPISIGNTANALALVAWAYGYEKSEDAKRIGKLAAGDVPRTKRK